MAEVVDRGPDRAQDEAQGHSAEGRGDQAEGEKTLWVAFEEGAGALGLHPGPAPQEVLLQKNQSIEPHPDLLNFFGLGRILAKGPYDPERLRSRVAGNYYLRFNEFERDLSKALLYWQVRGDRAGILAQFRLYQESVGGGLPETFN
jgi:hypothetical protein